MQDILNCAMGLDVHRDIIVACLAKGEPRTDPEMEINIPRLFILHFSLFKKTLVSNKSQSIDIQRTIINKIFKMTFFWLHYILGYKKRRPLFQIYVMNSFLPFVIKPLAVYNKVRNFAKA